MTSGLLGYERRVKRNKLEIGHRHRLGSKGVSARLHKKASNKSDWHQKVSKGDLIIPDSTETGTEHDQGISGNVRTTSKPLAPGQEPPITVLFVERTVKGGLVTQLRRKEKELAKIMGNHVRIVEKAGVKLEQLLSVRDPWAKDRCGRDMDRGCKICQSEGGVDALRRM